MQKSDRLVFILLVGGIMVMLLWMMRAANLIPGSTTARDGFGLGPGDTAPAIVAKGWINGKAPTEESLRGKVVVVDAWAYWCGYCLQDAPALVSLYQKLQGEDVVFVGLTAEDTLTLDKSEQFVERAGYLWPNGYGARDSLIEFGANYLPAVWVVGRDGKVVWNSGMEHMETLESAIGRALAAPPAIATPAKADVDAPADAKDHSVSADSPTE